MIKSIINPNFPWKLPRFKWDPLVFAHKMTRGKWKAGLLRAQAGDVEAEFEVASGYNNGCKDRSGRVFVRPSARKAAVWYRVAAEHGSVSAQHALGVVVGSGKGLHKDPVEAFYWLKKAHRAQPSSCTASNIAVTYREIRNYRRAVHWFRWAVKDGDGGCLIQLGIHLYWGIGVRRNQHAAIRAFKRATIARPRDISESERDDAHFYLGVALLEGKGIKRSLAKARAAFESANRDGDHLAAERLLKAMSKMKD